VAAGVELKPLLTLAGLTERAIEDRDARVPVKSQIRLLELAGDALKDDFLGYHLAADYDLREIGLLYYVLASSDMLGEALMRTARYSGIVNEGVAVRCRFGDEFAISIAYVGVERRTDRHQIEFWLTSLVRTCRQLVNRRLMPSRVRVIHHRKEVASELNAFLGCDVEFGADVDEIVFAGDVNDMPVVSADRYLNDLLLKFCEGALSHRPAGQSMLRPNLENTIAPLLPHGKARAGEIARRLGMSQRTLTRRLASEGLSFGGILDEMKADLARHYLKDDNLTISEIAWLLGYREVSAFTHAFKRWTGQTPREIRLDRHDARPQPDEVPH
jgi:AraC-like DNA-binding protein